MAKQSTSNSSSRPGRFKINYQKRYAMLTVNPPSGGGRPVYVGEVMSRMKMLRIPMVRKLIVEQIIERASGKPERLVEWPGGAKLSASLEVYISEDNMLATCVMHRPKKAGGSLTEGEVLDALREREVIFGFQMDNLRNMVSEPLYEQEIIAAKGEEPVVGSAQKVNSFSTPNPENRT